MTAVLHVPSTRTTDRHAPSSHPGKRGSSRYGTKSLAALQEEKEQPQKEEEEAKGVEMEGDFDGDLFDLPSDADNHDEEGEQDEDEDQRLDQEMGDVGEEGQVGFFLSSIKTGTSDTRTAAC